MLAAPRAQKIEEREETTGVEEAGDDVGDNVEGAGEQQETTEKSRQQHLLEKLEELWGRRFSMRKELTMRTQTKTLGG